MKKIHVSLFLAMVNILYAQPMQQPLTDKELEGNFNVGATGFYLPQENFIEIAKEYFLKNDEIGRNSSVKFFPNARNLIENDPNKFILQIADSASSVDDLALPEVLHQKIIQLKDLIPEGSKLLGFQYLPYQNDAIHTPLYYFPCQNYVSVNCVLDTIQAKDYIEETIASNQILLDHFEKLINLSSYNQVVIPSNLDFNTLYIPNVINIYMLTLSQAILEIEASNLDQGLDQLQRARKRIDLTYEAKSLPSLIEMMLVVASTQLLDQAMNGLLNSGLLNDHLNNPQLEQIMSPYPSDLGIKVQKSIVFEMKFSAEKQYRPYLMLNNKEISSDIQLNKEDEYILLMYWKNAGFDLSPSFEILLSGLEIIKPLGNWDRVKTLGQLDENINSIISDRMRKNFENMRRTMFDKESASHSQASLAELQKKYELERGQWYVDYFKSFGATPEELIEYLNKKYPSDEFINNIFNAIDELTELNQQSILITKTMFQEVFDKHNVLSGDLLSVANPMEGYVIRVYEQQNYHQLVYLKYLIMRDKISIDKIPEFLVSMGDLAKNTVTKVPYHFDAENHTLSTPLPELKNIPHAVRSAMMNDKSIQDFSVWIPNL